MRTKVIATVLAAASLAAGADETATRVRAVATRGQEVVFLLKAVVSIEVQGQEQELKIEALAVVLDSSGLMVTSDPEGRLAGLPAGAGVSTKGFQLVLADGSEAGVKVVGRDTDFGLIFLRLSGKDAPALPSPLAVHGAALQLGDQVFLLQRNSLSHPEIACFESRVTSVMQKPRLMYMISTAACPCCVALTPEGKLVGLTVTVKEQDPENGRVSQMMVVLPIAQVQEVAKGIRDGAPADETPGK